MRGRCLDDHPPSRACARMPLSPATTVATIPAVAAERAQFRRSSIRPPMVARSRSLGAIAARTAPSPRRSEHAIADAFSSIRHAPCAPPSARPVTPIAVHCVSFRNCLGKPSRTKFAADSSGAGRLVLPRVNHSLDTTALLESSRACTTCTGRWRFGSVRAAAGRLDNQSRR